MATWHQRQNPAGLRALWAPHPTEWKCISDKWNDFSSSISFADRASAEAYCKKTGDILIPPLSERNAK